MQPPETITPWENYTPDGIKIPEGSIYGKDFVVMPPIEVCLGSKEQWDKYNKQYNKELTRYKKK